MEKCACCENVEVEHENELCRPCMKEYLPETSVNKFSGLLLRLQTAADLNETLTVKALIRVRRKELAHHARYTRAVRLHGGGYITASQVYQMMNKG